MTLVADEKALNTVMQMKGHSSKYGCKTRVLEGVKVGSIYFYRTPADPYNPPIRKRLRESIHSVVDDGRKTMLKGTGIRGLSPFLDLPGLSIHFPRSAPPGPVHLVLINVLGRNLVTLWKGGWTFEHVRTGRGGSQSSKASSVNSSATSDQSDASDTAVGSHGDPGSQARAVVVDPEIEDYILPAKTWDTLGSETVEANKTIPAQIARLLRSISRFSGQYTAAGWSTWLLLFAIPLMTGRLSEPYLENLKLFANAYEMMLWKVHTDESLAVLKDLFVRFVQSYEALYVKGDPARLRLMTSTIHGLLHIADGIADFGSVASYWEFGIERIGDMLIKMIRCRRLLSEGLQNAIVLQENVKCVTLIRPSMKLGTPKPVPPEAYRVDQGWFLPKRVKASIFELEIEAELEEYMQQLRARLGYDQVCVLQYAKNAEMWDRYKMDNTGHIVGSRRSQTTSPDNRASHYIRYQDTPLDPAGALRLYPMPTRNVHYGEVHYYLRLQCFNQARAPPYITRDELQQQGLEMESDDEGPALCAA